MNNQYLNILLPHSAFVCKPGSESWLTHKLPLALLVNAQRVESMTPPKGQNYKKGE